MGEDEAISAFLALIPCIQQALKCYSFRAFSCCGRRQLFLHQYWWIDI